MKSYNMQIFPVTTIYSLSLKNQEVCCCEITKSATRHQDFDKYQQYKVKTEVKWFLKLTMNEL